MSTQAIPEEVQQRFPEFCRLVEVNQFLNPLSEGYVVDAVYTSLDDVPCESHYQGYRWSINLPANATFTTALIFFNHELVFAWCLSRVYVDRIPKNLVLNFETDLGSKYRKPSQKEIFKQIADDVLAQF